MRVIEERMSALDAGVRRGWVDWLTRMGTSGPYCLPAWGEAIGEAYGLDVYGLTAQQKIERVRGNDCFGTNPASFPRGEESVCGVLSLVHVNHWLFGNSLVSMPYCDGGSGAATNVEAERALISGALDLATKLGAPVVEVRRFGPLVSEGGGDGLGRSKDVQALTEWGAAERVDGAKVRMVLALPTSAGDLMRSFKAKLRSQINKPLKEGLTVRCGGVELLDDFYRVFVENMRDLGSPVHSKRFIWQILSGFGDSARVFVVSREGEALAASLALKFAGVMYNPWASSLRRYGHLAPSMLLYWSMLELACQQGCAQFDFGRSTVGEGTYRFKEQWGAHPAPLYWYRFVRDGSKRPSHATESDGMRLAAEIWKRLPVPATRLLGPCIRRYISL